MAVQDSQATGAARRLLIDGQLVDAQQTFPSVNPATGEVFAWAPDATAEHARASVRAARRAFDTTTWATDAKFRARCLDQFHRALVDHKEELRELTITEVGAPRQLTHANQLDVPIEIVRYYADLLPGYPMTEPLPNAEVRGQQHRRWVEKEAAGVVAAIIPYNYPNQIGLAKLAPALAAGCTMVLKGAPDTPLITLALGELIAGHTEIPPGVVNVLSSSQALVGEALTTHPDVDLVTFTGSTATGRAIMEAASRTVKRVFLELGGKSAMVVLDDADLGMVAMMAAFMVCSHAGQGCAIQTRLVVPRSQHDAIVEKVAAMMGHVKFGDPSDPGNYMGPLISERQRDKVHGMVQRAVVAGATLVTGGEKVDPGYFYPPTLLAGVDQDSEIAQDEVFGPVLAVIAHDGDDDAVRIANNSIFGLSGGVFSAAEDRAIAVARRIRSGTFSINGGNYFGPDAPFGGYKQSGIGREMGVAGLEEFLERKTFAAAGRLVVRPLEGIGILEVAMYGFVPSAGAVLADWGADVIKVEHAVTGDPQRGLRQVGAYKIEGDPNPNVEHANRGKRSIGLHMGRPEGREVLHELARQADVFLTSFLPSARRKFGIDVEDIRAVNPKIIYARGSALGPRGAEADRGGYDMTAFWARGTSAASLTPPNIEGLISPPPAYGDTISGTNLAGGIAAALFRRERTGEPSIVDVSLLGSGLWAMGHALAVSLHLGRPWVAPAQGSRGALTNPLSGLYRTADDRYLSFVMLQPTKFWADVCQHIDRPELADDARFASAEQIAANAAQGSKILQDVIASRTLAQWAERFATLAGPWAPVQDTLQAGSDPQIRANEYILATGELELASSPVQFDVSAPQLSPAPEFAAQTEEILLELGLDWDRITALKAAGAVT